MNAEAGLLSKGEIDALLQGVDNGEVELAGGSAPQREARPFDLAKEARMARGRMPALEAAHERFARALRQAVSDLLRRPVTLTAGAPGRARFGELYQKLGTPVSLQVVRLAPLRGKALFVLDARLVSALVECFFGGSGRSATIEGRGFTSIEQRIVGMLMEQLLAVWKAAWEPLRPLQPETLATESNHQFLDIAAADEVAVVTPFRFELDGAGGDLLVVMPYSMLEPIRDRLCASFVRDSSHNDQQFQRQLLEQLEQAEVELVPLLARSVISVERLLNARPGDIIPCDFDGSVTLVSEGMALLRGRLCASRGQHAMQVQQRLPVQSGRAAGQGSG